MNICNTEKLIIPGLCQIISGFVVKSLYYPGIPGWLISMDANIFVWGQLCRRSPVPTICI